MTHRKTFSVQASTTEEQDGTASSTSEEQEVTTKQPSSQTSNTFKY